MEQEEVKGWIAIIDLLWAPTISCGGGLHATREDAEAEGLEHYRSLPFREHYQALPRVARVTRTVASDGRLLAEACHEIHEVDVPPGAPLKVARDAPPAGLSPLGSAMVAGLSAFRAALDSGEPIEATHPVRTVRREVAEE